jgi:GlpG protein
MRQITTFDSAAHAERFQDYLIARGIKCSVDDIDAGFALWIMDEDRVEEAKTELAQFREQPDDLRYLKARQEANAVLKEEAVKRKAARRNVVRVSDAWRQPTLANCPLTIGIIAVCIFVFVETYLMGDQRGLSERLFISTDGSWRAIQQGEVWRLLTPMLMHGDYLHILFNLMWWWDFGMVLESRKGSPWFFGLVLLISVAANVLQFELGSPWFLGMSGVNFGLFGFLWVKGKLDPEDGFGVSQQIVLYMLLWFAVCWFGWVGRIANWAHAGGLMMGVILGSLSAAWRHGVKRSR